MLYDELIALIPNLSQVKYIGSKTDPIGYVTFEEFKQDNEGVERAYNDFIVIGTSWWIEYNNLGYLELRKKPNIPKVFRRPTQGVGQFARWHQECMKDGDSASVYTSLIRPLELMEPDYILTEDLRNHTNIETLRKIIKYCENSPVPRGSSIFPPLIAIKDHMDSDGMRILEVMELRVYNNRQEWIPLHEREIPCIRYSTLNTRPL
jgi:hypothetical protein